MKNSSERPCQDSSSRPAVSDGGRLNIPQDNPATLGAAFLATVQRAPGKGVFFGSSDGSGVHLTYRELLDRSARIRHGLQAAAIGPGDRVLLQIEQLPDHFAAFWACLLAGIAPVTVAIPTRYDEANSVTAKLLGAWRQLGRPCLLASDSLVEPLGNLARRLGLTDFRILSLNPLGQHSPLLDFPAARPEDVAFIQLTSGTTGIPKCIQITHHGVVSHIHSSTQFNGLGSADVFLNWLPLDHVVPILTFHIKGVYLGVEQIEVPTEMVLGDPLAWLDAIERHAVTYTWSPNFGFRLVADRLRSCRDRVWDLSCVKAFMNAGEQVTLPVVRDFLAATERFGVSPGTMQPAFGMAEVCTCMTYENQFDLQNSVAWLQGDKVVGCGVEPPAEGRHLAVINLGPPTPGVQIRIVDEKNRVLPEGVAGRLQIRGEVLTPGYYQNPSANAAAFVGGGWFNTGDLGFIVGGQLSVTGREKERIVIHGANYHCHEIESAVEPVSGIQPGFVAACAVPDPVAGTDALAIFFSPAAWTEEPSLPLIEAVRGAVASRTGVVPRYVFPVDPSVFPRTTSGKIQRGRLATLLEEGAFDSLQQSIGLQREALSTSTGGSRSDRDIPAQNAPQTELERLVAGVWGEVLEVPGINMHEEFLSLGGGSLQALQILGRLRAALALEIPLRRLMLDGVTVAKTATLIGELIGELEEGSGGKESSERRPSIERRIERGRQAAPARILSQSLTGALIPSFAQERLWFILQFYPDDRSYHVPLVLRICGPLQVPIFHRALNELVRRHESLRTAVVEQDGRPRLLIASERKLDLEQLDGSCWENEELLRSMLKDQVCRPFDLDRAPLVRATLIRSGPDQHVLLWVWHHIISDQWSQSILLRELGEVYAALSAGNSPSLPPLPINYTDFAVWQREFFRGDPLAREIAFWRKQLTGGMSPLDLPADRVRPAVKTGQGGNVVSVLDAGLVKEVERLSARHEVTLYISLLSAFYVLLFRLTQETDLVVGVPISGRMRPETEPVIGLFVNTLPIRLHLSNDLKFSEVLNRTRAALYDGLDHPDLPLEKLLTELTLERHPDRSPLFDVVFNLHNIPVPPTDFADCTMEIDNPHNDTAKFDLNITLKPGATGLELGWEYNSDLFDHERVRRWSEHFEQLVRGFVADPSAPISKVSLLDESEREQLLVDFNASCGGGGRESSVPHLFEEQVRETPRAVALVSGNRRLTYEELNCRSNRVARYLGRVLKTPETLVAVCLDRSAEMLVALLAILKAGAAYLPLDSRYPEMRLRFMLEDSCAPVVLTNGALAGSFPDSDRRVILLDEEGDAVARESSDNPGIEVPSRHLAYVLYTSGSTGRPKGVAVEHHSVVALIDWAWQTFGREQLEAMLCSTSICFDLSVFELFVPLAGGGRVILVEDLLHVPELQSADEVTFLNSVPSAMGELLRLGGLPSVRAIGLAGEPVSARLGGRCKQLPGCPAVWNLYGPTEDTVYSTAAEIKSMSDGAPPIGRPVAGSSVYILEPSGQPVPIGVPGELHLGGSKLARGYLNRPDLTGERFVPNPFSAEPGSRLYRTGDLARYRPDGTIEYLGRLDDQVKVRGFRIELAEIQHVLDEHVNVKESVVVTRGAGSGRSLVAYFVPTRDGRVSLEELRRHLTARLPDYMVPLLVPLDALPRTANGKIDRRNLPEPIQCAPRSSDRREFTPTEACVARFFEEILGIGGMGADAHFFDLGGHSLLATMLVARLRSELAVDIPLRWVFTEPTVGGLSHLIHAAQQASTGLKREVISRDSPIRRR